MIDRAAVVDKRIEFGGYLFAHDFPEIIELLAPGNSDLGVSYELGCCAIEDPSASVWKVTSCLFTGAAVLKKESAAYKSTWIELAHSAQTPTN